MPKPKNLEFLKFLYFSKNKPLKSPDDPYDELIEWLFNHANPTIEDCAKTAYRDIQRNLHGIGKIDKIQKQAYRDDIQRYIENSINKLFEMKVSSEGEFDKWHIDTCKAICEKSKQLPLQDVFTYGLAQKWLNMTIKNMLIAERWDEHLEKISKHLHVPVDSIILEVSSELNIDVIDKNGRYQPYKDGVSKPWSSWNEKDYTDFQGKVRKAVSAKGLDSPIQWESDAWLNVRSKM